MPTVDPPKPIEILVVAGNRIVVYPNHVDVPWDYKGTIVWRLAGDTNIVFRDKGVVFDETKKRYKNRTVIHPWRCEVSVDNDENDADDRDVAYRLLLWRDGQPMVYDPTVENDPPPPIR